MYHIGDKVVYPMHGAGIIEAVEEREVLGERTTYYVVRMPLNDLNVMIPVRSAQKVGLRPVADYARLQEVIRLVAEGVPEAERTWNRRYRENMEKMKQGDVRSVAEVVAGLSRRERAKGLSTGERRMLETARRILLSEICLAREIGSKEAEEYLASALA